MKLNSIALMLAIAALSGCAAKSVSLTYYLLHAPAATVHNTSADARAYVHITSLQIPDYLKQRNLAMQTSASTLHFAPKHVWAEPLNSGLTQAISESLWQTSQILVIPLDIAPPTGDTVAIRIQIDDFIATYDGDVVLKGQYWLQGNGSTSQGQLFDFRMPLKQDGFEHAVAAMRNLVMQLSEDIATHIP